MGPVLFGVIVGLLLGAASVGIHLAVMRRALRSSNPTPIIIAGFVLRLAVMIGVLFWLAGEDWRTLAAALVGFLLMRLALMYHLGLAGQWGNADQPPKS